MSKRLKVWGGLVFDKGKQVRIIVTTYTTKRAIEILEPYGITYYVFKDYWCETANNLELEIGLNNPEKIFVASSYLGKDFKEYLTGIDPLSLLSPFKKVSLSIEVPNGKYCRNFLETSQEIYNTCEYCDNEGGHYQCDFGFYGQKRYSENGKEIGILKAPECENLEKIK